MSPGLTLSFEFFPPKTEKDEAALWRTAKALAPFRPQFVSVTYGAGGSTRARTDHVVRYIKTKMGLEPAAHLTCVGAARDEIDEIARGWWDSGIRYLVALRGDPPRGAGRYEPHPDGYENAAALVAGLRRIADFDITVAAYPETHPESPSVTADLDNLKRKLDAGASRAITQFFFESATYLNFVERARAAGIDAPIIPGILPITNFSRAVRFAESCGAALPAWLAELYDGLDDDPEIRSLVAAAQATELCRQLQAEGVSAFHFYTLNRPAVTTAICRHLGIRSSLERAA
ncbi:MAG: methylenetetrahydrofolate reductase [NAD(P)H] [Rhodospirillaceae bacterium]|nr:methylenetetrahydrofolate reductase [NAD(P)H] [Rhodospirillaceae bacterium]MCY4238911.1 methylenetetrahydrofolate reductase [NAD(P)H] [Rhodospirillaceae bacterium]